MTHTRTHTHTQYCLTHKSYWKCVCVCVCINICINLAETDSILEIKQQQQMSLSLCLSLCIVCISATVTRLWLNFCYWRGGIWTLNAISHACIKVCVCVIRLGALNLTFSLALLVFLHPSPLLILQVRGHPISMSQLPELKPNSFWKSKCPKNATAVHSCRFLVFSLNHH